MATLDTSGTQGTPISADAFSVDVSSGNPVTIPEGLNPATADFVHEGPDLVMNWPDGSQVVVTDYFMAEDQPSLISTDGARVDGDIATRLAGSATPGQVAQVGEGVAEQPIGQVDTLSGTVTVVRADGTRVELKAGDPVYQGDILESSDDGAIGVVLADETTFSMAENGRMVLDEMVFDPGTQEGSVSLSVMQGVFTFVSGQVAKTDPDAMTLNTPVATIGIRGTQIGLDIADGKEMKIALMEEADGFVGEVVITNNAGVSVLNGANEFSTISSFNLPPTEVAVMSKSELVGSFGRALQSMPTPEGGNVNNYGIESEADIEKVVEEAKAEEVAEAAEEAAEEEAAEEEAAAEDLADFETAAGGEEAPPTADIPLTVAADEAADAVLDIPVVEEAPPEPEPEPEPEPKVAEPAPVQRAPEPEPVPTVVTVTATTDTLTVTEDSTVALNIDPIVTQGTGVVETVTVTGLDGATLSSGTDDGNGTITLTTDELAGLTVTTATDSTADLNLTVTATTNDGVTATDVVMVDVVSVGDAPTITVDVPAIDMLEDGDAVDLNITVTNPNAYEAVDAVTISGVDGATLSAGTDNGDGTWTLTPGQLTDLQLTPNADWNGSINIGVSATTDQGGSATVSDALTVNVGAVADAPIVSITPDAATEDAPFALNITAEMPAGTDHTVQTVTISGVPEGAVISNGTDVDITSTGPDQVITLNVDQLADYTMQTPADFNGTVSGLTLTATSNDNNASDTVSTDVVVGAVDDAPTVTVDGVSGNEDAAIALNIDVADADTDPSDVTVTIGNVPPGAVISYGTDGVVIQPLANGDYELPADQLEGLTLTPPKDSDDNISLDITASSSQGAETTSTMTVNVNAVADVPTVSIDVGTPTVNEAGGVPGWGHGDDGQAHYGPPGQGGDSGNGGEGGQVYPVDLQAALADTDGSETLSVTITGVPTGGELSVGTDNNDGSWTFNEADLATIGTDGLSLFISNTTTTDFVLSATATATEPNGDSESVSDSFSVGVDVVAVEPTLDVSTGSVSGAEDGAIALNISAQTVDPTDSLSITISGVPSGAVLSAGTNNQDGTWTISQTNIDDGALNNLTLTPPADDSSNFSLSVTATASDGTSVASTLPQSIAVGVSAVGDAPIITIGDPIVTGTEDGGAIDLNITVSNPNEHEAVETVTISGVEGGTLSPATQNVDGSWSVNPTDVSSLQFTPNTDWSGNFNLTVSATTDQDGSATGSMSIDVAVAGDAPEISATGASGVEDGGPIALNLSVTDPNSNETVTSVTVSGIPADATISAGSDSAVFSADGTTFSVTLTPDQLTGLQLTPEADFGGVIDLGISAVTDQGGIAGGTIAVDVAAIADDPTVSMSIGAPTVTTTTVPGGSVEGTFELGVTPVGSWEWSYNKINQGQKSGNDEIEGTDAADFIVGGAGNDELDGEGGNDLLRGDSGNDKLEGGDGNDSLFGGSGNDELEGGEGNDILVGGSGNDTVKLSGGREEYLVTQLGSTDIYVVEHLNGGEDGIDMVQGVENFQFGDGDDEVTMSLAAVVDSNPIGEDVEVSTFVYDISFDTHQNDTSGPEESLSEVAVSGIPDGAVLSAGMDSAVSNNDGTFNVTLNADQMDSLTLTTDDSIGSFDLNVSVTSFEGDTQAITNFDVMFADPNTLEVDGVEYDLSELTEGDSVDMSATGDVLGTTAPANVVEDLNEVAADSGYTVTTDGSDVTIVDIPDN